MNLTGIIAISGRTGLFKVIAQGKSNIIVESLIDKKRFPAYSTDKISALDDISIYTVDEDFPYKDLLAAIYEKEEGKACISHKEDISKLQAYLLEILPNYDQERVYPSDVKKMFQWYNLLLETGHLTPEEKPKEEKTAKAKKESSEDNLAEAPKKKTVKKTETKAKAPVANVNKATKPAAAKKTAATKTGSSRGK